MAENHSRLVFRGLVSDVTGVWWARLESACRGWVLRGRLWLAAGTGWHRARGGTFQRQNPKSRATVGWRSPRAQSRCNVHATRTHSPPLYILTNFIYSVRYFPTQVRPGAARGPWGHAQTIFHALRSGI